jgi:hypothetical protein
MAKGWQFFSETTEFMIAILDQVINTNGHKKQILKV